MKNTKEVYLFNKTQENKFIALFINEESYDLLISQYEQGFFENIEDYEPDLVFYDTKSLLKHLEKMNLIIADQYET